MDPLTLLRELFGEEPIRKVVTSGFDSVHKIAAATPESLSFFSGINEVVARQIVASAEESLAGPPPSSYRGTLTGSAEEHALQEPVMAVKPKTPPPPRVPAQREEKVQADLMDEDPLLDAGGILKTVAQIPRPKDLMGDDDFLDEVGLTDAEANFLEGISPWPGDAPRREKTSSAPLEATPIPIQTNPAGEEKEVEYAPVSDWSPEKDPDPVPRLVRAPELGPGPEAQESQQERAETMPAQVGAPEAPSPPEEPPAGIALETGAEPGKTAARAEIPEKPSLWQFGR